MNHHFFFIGKMPYTIAENEIEKNIPQLIATQQTQFTPDVNNDADRISVLEFSYWEAKPQCWMVFAKWQLIEYAGDIDPSAGY